jgi:hypothetical protein
LTANEQFQWPYNYSGSDKTLAATNDISCSVGVIITMPLASEVSNGETVIFKNIGSETLTIVKSDSSALTTVAAGVAVYLQVKDNTDEGDWSVTTFGTGTSAADAATLSGYGIKAIGSVLNAAYQTEIQSDSWSIDQYDRAKVFVFTGGVATCSLSAVSTFGSDFFCMVRNSGSGTLTIDPNASELVDGGSTLTLNPGESVVLVSTGTTWYTIGYGRSTTYQFTQLVKTVVAGSQTLSSSEASNKLLTFIGTPASSATVVVPSVVSIYYVHNNLSTSQTVTVKTAAGLGSPIPQGERAIIFCNGTDVLAAQTAEITGDISVGDGSYSIPVISFISQTNTGIYKNGTYGIGFSVNGVPMGTFDTTGFSVPTGYLQIPSVTTPAQIAEGALVWDSDSDLLTIGDGSGRKTMVDLTTAQTLTNKTLTSPVVNGGVWTVPSGSGSTTEGVVQWNTSSNVLTIGDGAATKTFVDTNSTQTLTNKTLTSPTITSPSITSPSLIGFVGGVNPLASNTTLTSNSAYSYSASGLTLTLPASPVNGDLIIIVNTSTQVDCIIARNTGKTIMGLAENLTFDKANASITLKCINGTDWRIV